MSDFDDVASTWDEKPGQAARTRVVADRLRSVLDFEGIQAGLEYGAGTGALSFALADLLPHCLLMDTSVEMLKVAERRVVERALPWDTERRNFATHSPDHPEAITDILFAMQVLHHVSDLETTILNMVRALKPGGQLALIDLPKGSSDFHRHSGHSHEDNPHLDGLDRGELTRLLRESGCHNVTWHEDIALERERDDGPEAYTLFLVTARV